MQNGIITNHMSNPTKGDALVLMAPQEPDETRELTAITADGALKAATIHMFDESPDDPAKVLLTVVVNQRAYSETNDDYWGALRNLRVRLEKDGLLLVCYGASRNISPSGMGSLFTHAYRLTPGRPALQADMVHLFDTGPDVDPVTVEEQDGFVQEWLKSLAKRPN